MVLPYNFGMELGTGIVQVCDACMYDVCCVYTFFFVTCIVLVIVIMTAKLLLELPNY